MSVGVATALAKVKPPERSLLTRWLEFWRWRELDVCKSRELRDYARQRADAYLALSKHFDDWNHIMYEQWDVRAAVLHRISKAKA